MIVCCINSHVLYCFELAIFITVKMLPSLAAQPLAKKEGSGSTLLTHL